MSQIKQDDTKQEPKYPLGTVVDVDVDIYDASLKHIQIELKGACRLIVVGHQYARDGTLLYVLSDLPVQYPTHDSRMFTHEKLMYQSLARLVEFGYSEESLRPSGETVLLKSGVDQWLCTTTN